MKKWESRINGKQLREEIRKGVPFDVLKTLRMELKFKLNRMNDEEQKEEFDELYDLVDSDVELGEEGLKTFVENEGWTLQELVDDRLAQFYDLCDRHNVWVTV